MGVGYDRSGMFMFRESDSRSSVPNRQLHTAGSPLPKFSKRYWLYGLSFSSQTFLCSPFIDHSMPVTSRICLQFSRFELRTDTVNCLTCCVSCS